MVVVKRPQLSHSMDEESEQPTLSPTNHTKALYIPDINMCLG